MIQIMDETRRERVYMMVSPNDKDINRLVMI